MSKYDFYSKKYFLYSDILKKLNFININAMVFKSNGKKYDFIFNDLYIGEKPAEFFYGIDYISLIKK